MYIEEIEKIYSLLSEIAKFIKFNRKQLAASIGEQLDSIAKKYTELESEVNNKNSTITLMSERECRLSNDIEKFKNESEQLEREKHDLMYKYDFISNILSAVKKTSDNMEKLSNLLNNDFINFANRESSLAEEAAAMLLLQSIEKKMLMITSFPEIYNKKIIAIGGGFSSGKSSFINSFLKVKDIKLPVGIDPVTAIPAYIVAGEQNIVKGLSKDKGYVHIPHGIYTKLTRDFISHFPFNLKNILPVMAIETPFDYKNICFIDTPGYDSADPCFTMNDMHVAKEYLNNADAIIWLIGLRYNGTMPKSDIDFLKDMDMTGKKLYIVLNQADLKSDDDLQNIFEEVKDVLDDYEIPHAGINVYDSNKKKELFYGEKSVLEFLDDENNSVEVKTRVLKEFNILFNMYYDALHNTIESKKDMSNTIKSIELDMLETGYDFSEIKLDHGFAELKNLSNCAELHAFINELDDLKLKIITCVNNIFDEMDMKTGGKGIMD